MEWWLLLLGCLCIFLEFYLPGAVIGSIGGLFILAGLALEMQYAKTGLEVLFYISTIFVAVGFTVYLALRAIRTTGKNQSIFLESDQEGYHVNHIEEALKGKKGIAQTNLRPGGFVIVEGKRYTAISLAQYIQEGKTIIVIDVEGETVKVKEKT